MCRVKARKQFVSLWRELVIEVPRLKGDKIAKREDWANYIDGLCKDGEITLKQYENWL